MVARLVVGGLERMSLCDWPGQLVATVFCQGCPWRCAYCHNPHLLPAKAETTVEWQSVLDFLDTRRNLLDGVVFSGGEPTLQSGLGEAISDVRAMGFRIGLHSAGPFPDRLAEVLPSVDWVGFDIKAPFSQYDRITGGKDSGAKALESLLHLLASGVDFEVRTTVHPALLDDACLEQIRAELRALGILDHKVQEFRAAGCADPVLTRSPAPARRGA